MAAGFLLIDAVIRGGAIRSVSERVRRTRMASQRLTDASQLGPDPAAIARAVCGVQAQDRFAATLQLRVRSSGLTAAVVEDAIEVQRSVVRTWLMRGTLHLCAADDLRWMLGVFGPVNHGKNSSRRKQLGLDDALCERSVRIMRRALAGGPMSRHELRAKLIAQGVPIDPTGQAMIHLLAYAAHHGVIVVGAQRGRDALFVLLEDWVRASPGPTGEAAIEELARRYLAAFAPARVEDFATWSGLAMAPSRRAWSSIGGELVAFPGPVEGLWMLRAARGGSPPGGRRHPDVRLLPHFDTYLLGYRGRDLMLDPARAEWLVEGGGGWIRPMVCVDGWLVGGWRLERGRKETVATVSLFEVDASVREGIDVEVAAIGAFLGRPIRLEMDTASG